MAFSKKFAALTSLQWDTKPETTDDEKSVQKKQLQLATTNILQDIEESITHILEYTKQLQNQTNSNKSKIVLTENCNAINYFCQCIERMLLFGFKKKIFRSSLWSFISESTAKCFENCQQLESDINLIKSISILNETGRLRAFLRQSFRSKSIAYYFELISEQTDIIQIYYMDFSIMNQKHKINQLLIQLNKLNTLSDNIQFQMLLNDKTLNITQYFKTNEYNIPQWIITQNKNDFIINTNKQNTKKKKKKKHKQKTKRRLHLINSTDDIRVRDTEQKDEIHKNNYKKKHKKKKKKKRKDKKIKIEKNINKLLKSESVPPILAINNRIISKQRSYSLDANSKNNHINFDNIFRANSENKEMYLLKDEKIKFLQSELDKIQMERNDFKQQIIQQKNEILNLQLVIKKKNKNFKEKLEIDLNEMHEINSFSFDCEEKGKNKWRNELQISDGIDYKFDSVWITATIIGYKENDSNKLKLRFDGWNCDNFEDEVIISRYSQSRLSKYKSQTGIINHNQDNILFEGFMYKEGGSWKTWKKRYFRLDFQGNIRYYNQKGDKEFINQFSTKLSSTKMDKDKKCFYVTTEDRTWKFSCNTNRDTIKWINAINFAKQV